MAAQLACPRALWLTKRVTDVSRRATERIPHLVRASTTDGDLYLVAGPEEKDTSEWRVVAVHKSGWHQHIAAEGFVPYYFRHLYGRPSWLAEGDDIRHFEFWIPGRQKPFVAYPRQTN